MERPADVDAELQDPESSPATDTDEDKQHDL
jgi:hypothetical protein